MFALQTIVPPKIDWSFWSICKMFAYFVCIIVSSTLDYIEVKKEVVVALAIAMAFDTLTGILKASVLSKTDPSIRVTSREGKKGVLEKILMLLGVVLLGVISKLLGLDLSWLVVNALILLTVFETFSFFGNIGSIRSGKQMAELDAISYIIKFVRNALKVVIEKFLDQKEKPSDEDSRNN